MTTAGWTGPADSKMTVPQSAPIARPIKSATRTSWAGLEPAIAPQRAHVPGESNDCQNNSLALFIILTVLSTAMNDEPTAIPGRSSLLLQPNDAICRNRAAAIRAQGGIPPEARDAPPGRNLGTEIVASTSNVLVQIDPHFAQALAA